MNRSKKSALMSALFMGLGQLYNRDYVKGIAFMIIEILTLINIPKIAHAMWGLVTLGETPQKFVNGVIVQGDHSIFLLIEGVITLIILSLIIGAYIYNVFDAKKTGNKVENGESVLSPKEYIQLVWDRNFAQIVLTPAFLSVIFFILLPILATLLLAFTNYSSPNHLPPRNLVDWVGFDNFFNIFKLKIWNNTFIKIAGWTAIWAIASTLINYFVGLGLALLTNAHGIKLKKVWRTIFILPYAIPAFISLLVFRLAFSGTGPVNTMIANMGFDKIPFFTDPFLAKVMIIAINIWLGSPYFMVLMSGMLTNIPKSLYEAAEIDGATKWQQFKGITLPMIFFQTAPILIMTFAYNFNNFSVIYLLTDGNPINPEFKYAGSTDILITWIFKLTKDQGQFHMAAVISIVLFAFIAIISAYSFSRTKSFTEEDMM